MKSLWKNFATLVLALSTGLSLELHGFGQAIGSPAESGGGTGGGSKGPGAAVPGAAAGAGTGDRSSTAPEPGRPTTTGGGAGGGTPGARPSATGAGAGTTLPLTTGRQRVAPTPGVSQTTPGENNPGLPAIAPVLPGTTTTGVTAAGGVSASSGLSTAQGQLFRAKQILGSQVQLSGNITAGTVDDFVVDENGYVEYVIVNNSGQFVTVPWDATAFNFEKQTAVINIAPAVFQKIPTFTADRYPVFSEPEYRTTIYRAYGLTPRVRPVLVPRQ